MAGINRKVKASTLVEVVVAMVVITIVLTIAMAIYDNILRSSVSFSGMRSKAVLYQLLKKTNTLPVYTNQTFTYQGLKINRKVSVYQNKPHLKEIRLIAFDQNRDKIAEVRKVVYDTE